MARVNMADYDSEAVRAAARKLRGCAQRLSDGTKGKLQTLRRELPYNLEGNAAQALQGSLNDINTDVNTVLGGINGLIRALNNYADDLDRAAARLQQQLMDP